MSGAAGRGSAVAVRVATTDVVATDRFLRLFGFRVAPDAGGGLWFTAGAGAPVWLEPAEPTGPEAPVAPEGFQRGPRALDLYTTDLEGVLADAAAAGHAVSGPGTIAVGPVTMRQALVVGPDGFPVVLVESTHRRSSALDDEPTRRCSEPHSVVWCVDDLDAEAARWQAAGWTKGPDLSFTEPAVSEYLGLPRSPVPIRMTMLSGPGVEPVRLELLEFPEDPGAPMPAPAIAGLVFRVADAAERATVAAALELDAVTGRTPGGVAVELRPA